MVRVRKKALPIKPMKRGKSISRGPPGHKEKRRKFVVYYDWEVPKGRASIIVSKGVSRGKKTKITTPHSKAKNRGATGEGNVLRWMGHSPITDKKKGEKTDPGR